VTSQRVRWFTLTSSDYRNQIRLTLAEHLSEMDRKGLLKRPVAPLPADLWDWPRPVDSEATVRAAVTDEREEDW